MKKILVIEDDENLRGVLRFALEEEGHKVLSAENGETGVEMARSSAPDLILLDVLLPDINGLEVCRSLKCGAEFKSIPVIMLTAIGDTENIIRGFTNGAADYVSKPFNLQELLVRVRSHLRMKDLYDIVKTEEEEKSALLDVSKALSSTSGPHDTLYLIVSKIAEVMEVKRCSIIYIDPKNQHGFVMASHDSRKIRHLEINLEKYPEIQKVRETGEPVIINDVYSDPILFTVRDVLSMISIKSIMAFPISFKESLIGTLILRTSRDEKAFNDREIRFCGVIAHLSAAPLKNAYMMEMLHLEKEHERQKRREAEEKIRSSRELLEASEERYRTLIDSSPVCICHITLEGKLVYMNPAGRRLHEIDNSKDLPGMDISGHGLKKEYQDIMMDALKRAKKGQVINLEYAFTTPGGEEKWVECVISPVRDADGGVESLLRISADRTERKRSHEEMKLMALFPSLNPGPVIRCDKNGIIQMANPAAMDIFRVEDPVGMPLKNLLPGLGEEALLDCISNNSLFFHSTGIGNGFFQFIIRGSSEMGVAQIYGSDITELRLAEESTARLFEELKEAKEKLEKTNEELIQKFKELERFHKLTMDREERIIQLKKKVKELEKELEGKERKAKG